MAQSPGTQDSGVTCALGLGWRIAYLYALADDDLGKPLGDTLLPLHESLKPEDQLELQVRTAAGDASHVGLSRGARALEDLVEQARAAGGSHASTARFRKSLRQCHIEIDKELWASCEITAKAYELGNGLSDTYNRICRAYRNPRTDVSEEWRLVFDEQRIRRLKDCLHDLQSRLDPCAVTVVSEHLDAWRTRVATESFRPPTLSDVRTLLRRQTVVWRQLLVGDKQPEAFLNRHQRTLLRRELGRLIWKRYLPCFPALVAMMVLLFAAALNFAAISRWYEHNLAATGAVTLLASVAGALGITMASVGLSVRSRMSEWTELLWNRAIALRVTQVTLNVNELVPPPTSHPVAATVRHAGRRTRDTTRRATRRATRRLREDHAGSAARAGGH